MRHRKTGNLTSDEASIQALILRLQKGTIKPKNATVEEAIKVLKALVAISVWSTWRTNFFTPKGVE